MTMNKIAIIGSSGSGKSYLAEGLGNHYDLPVIDLDDVILDENYEKPPLDVYRERVRAEAEKDHWIIEGVYPKVGDIVWTSADAVVWLNLPFDAIRKRYEERDLERQRSGPFPDVEIHKKEYARLNRVYPEMLGELPVENVVEVTDPEYTIDDIASQLEGEL